MTDSTRFLSSFWFFVPSNTAAANFFGVNQISAYISAILGPGMFCFGPGFAAGTDDYFDPGAEGAWHHFLGVVDILGTPHSAVYIDGVDALTDSFPFGTGAAPIEVNGYEFDVGGVMGGDHLTGYLADFWFDVGVDVLDGSTIPPEVVAKFISSGKPVDLGEDGSTPFGSAPAVFLRAVPGDETDTFVDNLGGGGAFTVAEGSLSVAPSSPSD